LVKQFRESAFAIEKKELDNCMVLNDAGERITTDILPFAHRAALYEFKIVPNNLIESPAV
jgi:hypothetical protein